MRCNRVNLAARDRRELPDGDTSSSAPSPVASRPHVAVRGQMYTAGMLCLILCLSYSPGVAAAQDDEWSWIVTPYGWAANTSSDLKFNDVSEDAQLDFSDVLDKVELGGQVHIEASKGRWGGFLDLTYVSVKDDENVNPKFPPAGAVKVGVKIETLLGEVAGTYRIWGEPGLHGVDLLLGGRWTEVDVDLDISTSGPADIDSSFSGSDTFTDAFAGARYITPIGQRWEMALRGDVGTGDADLIWNGQLNLAYFLGGDKKRAIVLAYRYTYVEYDTKDNGNKLEADITVSGPELGFAFLF